MRTTGARLCVLASGGLDSAVLVAQALRRGARVSPVYVRCGLRWEQAELASLRRLLRLLQAPHLEPLAVLTLPLAGVYRIAGPRWSLGRGTAPSARSADAAVYLPGRNIWLIAAAATFCASRKISTIALGTLKGNPFGDASPAFFGAIGRLLTRALGRPVRVVAPLRTLRKAQVARLALGLPLGAVFSCLQPKGRRPCGRCNKCAELQRAMRTAGKRGHA